MAMQGRLGLSVRVQESPYGRNFEFTDVAPESSAARAGIHRGDLLKSIDNYSIDGWDLDRVTEKLRGDVGTWVHLGVLRRAAQIFYQIIIPVQREPPITKNYQQQVWLQHAAPGQIVNGVMGVQSSLNQFGTNLLTDAMSSLSLKSEYLLSQPIDRSNISLPVQGAKVGLTNLGNTCFLNSIMQCLVHSVHFANYLIFNFDVNSSKKESAVMKTFVELVGHMWSGEHTKPIEPRSLFNALREDKRCSALFNSKQQDAHEFLCLLLDILHDDSNGLVITDPAAAAASDAAASTARTVRPGSGSASSSLKASCDWEEVPPPSAADDSDAPAAAAAAAAGVLGGAAEGLAALDDWGYVEHSDAAAPATPEPAAAPGGGAGGAGGDDDDGGGVTAVDSMVSKFMGGRLCSEVKCNKCGFSTQNYEPFFVLSLSLPPRRMRAFQGGQVSLEECLELLESEGTPVAWECSNCRHGEASKRMRIASLPHCLVLHLKRFAYDNGRRYKRDDEVLIRVNGLACRESPPRPAGKPGPGGGGEGTVSHYDLQSWCEHLGSDDSSGHYTAAARTLDGTFHRFDDGRVSAAAVAKPGGGAAAGGERFVSRSAYVLFYERVGSGPAV